MPNTPERSFVIGKPGWELTHDGVGLANPAIKVNTARCPGVVLENESNLPALVINNDAESAANVYALKITSDNSGTGKGCGIDLSAFSQDEPLLHVPASGTACAGTISGKIAIAVSGTATAFYVAYHLAKT